jgi:hypothetical protein
LIDIYIWMELTSECLGRTGEWHQHWVEHKHWWNKSAISFWRIKRCKEKICNHFPIMSCVKSLSCSAGHLGFQKRRDFIFQTYRMHDVWMCSDWLIDWCLTPTLAIFQLYHGAIWKASIFRRAVSFIWRKENLFWRMHADIVIFSPSGPVRYSHQFSIHLTPQFLCFFVGDLVSNTILHHDIVEILLKLVLNTNQSINLNIFSYLTRINNHRTQDG